MEYLAIGEEYDKEDYVICRYRIKTDMAMEKAADIIAAEQSTGTWTGIATDSPDIKNRLGAKVVDIQGPTTTIIFPKEDVCPTSRIPQLLSLISGNLFGIESFDGVRLESVEMPRDIVKLFPGPKFGLEGMRDILDHRDIPFIGTIVKPKIGLGPKESADYVYEGGMGGLTNSKDDETLVDQAFCPIVERATEIADAMDRVREETGRRMVHAMNITAGFPEIMEMADRVQEAGANQIMVDVLTCGYGALEALAKDPSVKVPIHVHRAMHGAMTRDPHHGVSMEVLALLSRLAGGDAVHIGTFGVGKMHGGEEDLNNRRVIVEELYGMRPMVPVCSGGLFPLIVPELIEKGGADLQIQAGGGVAGHPDGVRAGARAMVEASEAAVKGVTIEEYAKEHAALARALEKWGGKEVKEAYYDES